MYLGGFSSPWSRFSRIGKYLQSVCRYKHRGKNDGLCTGRSDSLSKRTVKSIERINNPHKTRGQEDDIYVVNYDGEGFAIVSTDPTRTPVCAFSPSGTLAVSDTSSNPGLKEYMDLLVGGTVKRPGGHAWIIDGTYTYYYGDLGYVPGLYQSYYHTVWGWGGDYNGYFMYGDSVARTPGHVEKYETVTRLNHTYGGFKGIGKLTKR